MPVESGLPTYVRKKLTGSSILKNKELIHTLDHLNNKVISSPEDFSKSNLNTYTGETTFTINTDVANYLEYGAYHSYTFPVSRSVDNGLLENLLLSLQNDGTYKSILIAYDVTEIEKKMMLNDELVDLDGKTSFTILHNQDWANNMNKSIGEPDNMCMSYTMTVPRCSFGGLHSATDIENNVNNGANCKSKPLGGVAEPYMTFYFTECEGRQAGSPGDAYTPPPYDDFGNYTGLGSPRDREPSGPSTGNDGQQPPDDEDNTNDPDPLEDNDNCVQQDHNGNCVREMTAPIVADQPSIGDECKKIKDLLDNPDYADFKLKLQQQAQPAVLALPVEFGSAQIEGETTTRDFIGNAVVPEVTMPIINNAMYAGVGHNHSNTPTQGLSIFSPADMISTALLLRKQQLDASKFVCFLSTEQGTYYAFTINDPQKFLDLFYANTFQRGFLDVPLGKRNLYFKSKDKFEKFNKKYFDEKLNPKIKPNDPTADVLKEFLKFMNEADCGISLFQTDANFDDFTPLILENDNTKLGTPCN